MVFWYLEGLWKITQSIHIARVGELEDLLTATMSGYRGPRIGQIFQDKFRARVRKKEIFRLMRYRNVWMPHLFIFLLGAFLFGAAALKIL